MSCDGTGASPRNIGIAIGTYGFVWLLWLLLNRFLCERFFMMDAYMSFAQIAGTMGDMQLQWPGRLPPSNMSRAVAPAASARTFCRPRRKQSTFCNCRGRDFAVCCLVGADDLAVFLKICGILVTIATSKLLHCRLLHAGHS